MSEEPTRLLAGKAISRHPHGRGIIDARDWPWTWGTIMPRLSSIVVTVALLLLYPVNSGESCRAALGQEFGLQTEAPPRAEAKTSAARPPLADQPVLVTEPFPGRPRERLRDRIRERREERRKTAAEPSAAFAPGLQPLPGPAGAALPGQPAREPRPLAGRFRRMLGDLGLSVDPAGPQQPPSEWDYGTAPQLYPAQPGPMVQPNGPVAPVPHGVPAAPPGPWLRSPDDGGPVLTPHDAPSVTGPPQLPQTSLSAPTVPALPLLVPPDLSVPAQPLTGEGQSTSQVPTGPAAEDRDSDTSNDKSTLDGPTADAARGAATNSDGANGFGQLLGGVSRLFGGASAKSDTGRAAQASESGRSDATGNRSSPNSPSSRVESPSSDSKATSAGGTSKPSLEDIRKRILRRSSRSD